MSLVLEKMNETTIAILSASTGFIGKSLWDFFWKRKQDRESSAHKKRMDFLERQLNEFYWPLLFQLKKNGSMLFSVGNLFLKNL